MKDYAIYYLYLSQGPSYFWTMVRDGSKMISVPFLFVSSESRERVMNSAF